jgi:hypothetical protein
VLSDRELILHALNSNLSTIGRSGASSAQDFMARYPDCCSVYRESLYAPQNWFDRIPFGRRRAVGILVHVPPEVHSGIHYSRYEVVADVWACGEPGATYGNLVSDNESSRMPPAGSEGSSTREVRGVVMVADQALDFGELFRLKRVS